MYDLVEERSGAKAGPTSIVLAGVHGDEVCGINAFQAILPTIAIEAGRVLFLYGNPRAIEQGVRYVEANLNRLFKPLDEGMENHQQTYEYGRSQVLKTYLDQADALLDVHASSIPGSSPFVICEPQGYEIASFLPATRVVSGFDNIQPGGTDYYMNQQGKIGICFESGFRDDERATLIAQEAILAFLAARGHIERVQEPHLQVRIQIKEMYLTKTADFRLTQPFTDFAVLKRNQIIGYDGAETIRASEDGLVLFAHDRSVVGAEAFLFGKFGEEGV